MTITLTREEAKAHLRAGFHLNRSGSTFFYDPQDVEVPLTEKQIRLNAIPGYMITVDGEPVRIMNYWYKLPIAAAAYTIVKRPPTIYKRHT